MAVMHILTTSSSTQTFGVTTFKESGSFFDRHSKAKLTVNIAKTEFCHATLTFLGHLVGQGQVKPLEAKVSAISEFPVPKYKRQLMRFLGMAGYYRKFCKKFSVIAEPLTNLLKKGTKFKWNDKCQDAFDRLKAILKIGWLY